MNKTFVLASVLLSAAACGGGASTGKNSGRDAGAEVGHGDSSTTSDGARNTDASGGAEVRDVGNSGGDLPISTGGAGGGAGGGCSPVGAGRAAGNHLPVAVAERLAAATRPRVAVTAPRREVSPRPAVLWRLAVMP